MANNQKFIYDGTGLGDGLAGCGGDENTIVYGQFTAVESGSPISKTNLKTKVVNRAINFDLLLYDYNATSGTVNTSLLADHDASVGVFLSTIEGNNTVVPKKFLGTFHDFSSGNGRIALPPFSWNEASKATTLSFYFCNSADQNWTECWIQSNGTSSITLVQIGDGNSSTAYDNFAIRPDQFTIASDQPLLTRAGKTFDLNFQALDENNASASNYNENSSFTVDVSISDPSLSCAVPDLTISPDVVFSDGQTGTTGYTFDDVGVFDINISEIPGGEFAIIDALDTPDDERLISPFTEQLTVLPNSFALEVSLKNFNDGTFTYLSSDLNMSATLEVKVTAQNAGGMPTQNFTDSCHAKSFDLNITFEDIPDPLQSIVIIEPTDNTGIESSKEHPIMLTALPDSHFTDAAAGAASLSMPINFKRNITQPVNPFEFTLKEITVIDSDGTTGTLTDNSRIPYFYGRSHAPRYRIDNNSGDGTVYYEVYCRGACDATLMDIVAPKRVLSVDDVGWFRNELHDNALFGEVTAVDERSIANKISETKKSMTQWTFTYNQTRGYPYKALMQMSSSPWLLYNRFNNGAATNDFMVEFHRAGNWQNDTEHTTKVQQTRPAVNTSRRIDW